MPYFTYQDKRIYYRITGRGEPLLMIHGNTASSKMFNTVLKLYKKYYQLILLDLPGHGKSDRLESFDSNFWYYNSKVCYALLQELKIKKARVIGTSGGALIAINLAMEYPASVEYLVADSFEGEYPLESYIQSIKSDRERDKKKLMAKLFWYYCHGRDWKKIVDLDTTVNVEFYHSGRSFFCKPFSELTVPTLITGSREDEFCSGLDRIYSDLKVKNPAIKIHLFDRGGHPAIISSKLLFYKIFSTL